LTIRRGRLILFVVSAILVPILQYSCSDSGRDKPNIVFILADDMGYGDLHCQNPESKVPTPVLDKLAEQGMRFTDAHSPSSVCTPTRYGILTGRYCWRSRLKSSVLWEWDEPLIEDGRLTVAQFLKDKGYTTACIGKWHLGWDWPTTDGRTAKAGGGRNVDFSRPIGGGPTAVGFDYYFGDDVPNFPPYCFIENDRTVGVPTESKPDGMFGIPGPMMKGWKLENVMPAITRKAVEYIEQCTEGSQRDPFFLYFSLTAPHTPIAPAGVYIGKSRAGRYGDYVYQVDWTVGEILRALERQGVAENTLVIFTSDNGSPGRDGSNMNGAINSVRKYGHNPSRPWRGIKADIWEGGHRVPFVARWPERIPAGQTNDELICLVDFMATVAAILGERLPGGAAEDSFDLLPALFGVERDKPVREEVIHHSMDGLFSIRRGRWKLILGLGAGGFSGEIREPEEGEPAGQLYDLVNDPQEEKNLYELYPEIVEELTRLHFLLTSSSSLPYTRSQ
jgi:arylsulfatase A